MITRVGLFLLLACSVTVSSRPTTAAAFEARPPNIVLIFTDDLGYADIGPFGAKGYATPHLDRLARQGRRFTQFYVAQAVCSASRAALLTGCYPNRIGFSGALGPLAKTGLADGELTLAELLKQRNYATAIYGKWHLGHPPGFRPMRHGFDDWYGLPYSNDMWPLHPESKPGTWPDLPLFDKDTVVNAALQPADQERLTTDYTERAVRFIRENSGRPFFLYLAHSMPHVPLYVSEKFKGRSQRGLFGDVIMEIDWSVGEVMRALERHGIANDTLVIFTSDNGPWLSYGDHAGSAFPLREGKGTSWEGGVRVPCIMRWPGRIPADTTCELPLMTIDLLPTIAGLTGTTLPEHPIDGRDVWPLLAGHDDAENPHEAYGLFYQRNDLEAVLSGDGRWKLVFPHTYRTMAGRPGGFGGKPAKYTNSRVEQPELYDLQVDPQEANDVAARYPETVARLRSFAEALRRDLGDELTGIEGTGVRPPGRAEETRAGTGP